MKSYKKILLTAAASLIIGTQAFAAEKLRIGTEGAYPPFNLIDASGKVVGFDLDISHALCAKMKVECEVVTSDWDGIIPALNAGKFDFLAASMSVTEERKNAVDFTDHYYDIKLYDTQENAYLDLASGRVDGILADTFVQWEWLKSDAGKNFEFKGEPVFDDDKIAIAVRKGNDELRERLNKALAEIIADGTYKQINDKYFPFSIY